MSKDTLRGEINGLVHLVGCQVYTIGNFTPNGIDTDEGLKEVERLEKMLAKELLKLISKECDRAVTENASRVRVGAMKKAYTNARECARTAKIPDTVFEYCEKKIIELSAPERSE